jgi:hypothetical protein
VASFQVVDAEEEAMRGFARFRLRTLTRHVHS